jgi:hypothetical protein
MDPKYPQPFIQRLLLWYIPCSHQVMSEIFSCGVELAFLHLFLVLPLPLPHHIYHHFIQFLYDHGSFFQSVSLLDLSNQHAIHVLALSTNNWKANCYLALDYVGKKTC